MRVLMGEGFLSAAFHSLTSGAFLTGLVRTLGAGPLALSLFFALPFLAQIGQFAALQVEQKLTSRKRFVVPGLTVARALWLVMAALAWSELKGSAGVGIALVVVVLLEMISSVATIGWTAWLADSTPAGDRAQVFGRRAAASALAMLLITPLCGRLLDELRQAGRDSTAYGIVCLIAAGLGIWGALLPGRLPDAPPAALPAEGHLLGFRRLGARQEFRETLGFFIKWNFALAILGPFVELYMLEQLQMGFALIAAYSAVELMVRFLVNNLWIRIIDQVGSQRVLLWSATALSATPLLWMIPRPGHYVMIWPIAVLEGVFWSGFRQAAFIQQIAVVGAVDRSRGLALLNVGIGAALFVGGLLSGVVLRFLGTESRTGFTVLFLLSAGLRVTAIVLARSR